MADARFRFPGSPYLTVRFHQERSFKTLSNQQNDRPLSARTGHSTHVLVARVIRSPGLGRIIDGLPGRPGKTSLLNAGLVVGRRLEVERRTAET